MTHIIAGRLQQQDQVQEAIAQLIHAGYPEDQISSFQVNPPGQHDLYPVGAIVVIRRARRKPQNARCAARQPAA